MSGFTRLDNETDLETLLKLPNALAQPYLFLLSRARLTRPGIHWGEMAAALGRSQTQTHAALRGLKELGLAQEDSGLWTGIRRKPCGNPAEIPRKPAMKNPEKTVQNEEIPTPKEVKKEVKEQKEEQIKEKAQNPAALVEMPADLSALPGMPEAWDDWMAYRRERKLSTTPSTVKGMFARLQRFRAEGQDPLEVIRNSIENGYAGLFQVKSHIVRFQPAAKTTEEANDRVTRRALELHRASKEPSRAVF